MYMRKFGNCRIFLKKTIKLPPILLIGGRKTKFILYLQGAPVGLSHPSYTSRKSTLM
jgi:hypothetical protein